jgi:hypothetical protein
MLLLSRAAILTLAIVGTMTSWKYLGPGTPSPTAAIRHSAIFNASHLAHIKQRYDIEGELDYFTRIVRFRRIHDLQRKSLTIVPQALLNPTMTPIDSTRQTDGDIVDAVGNGPLKFEVPLSGLPSTVNASQLMFGISTTFQRLNESNGDIISDWKYWLTDGYGASNGAKLLLLLWDASEAELQDARTLLDDAGIDANVDRSKDRDMAVRYINLIPLLYQQVDSRNTKWLILCDDDTFFPSMHGLNEKLDSFDYSKQLYIGTLSEDIEALERHGSQAFGGAGVILSLPMAKTITQSIRSCSSASKLEEAGWQGDKLLHNCIYDNSNTRLVLLPDLWQLDFRGDASGFYEWGHKPLSLHHYRGGGWHKARPLQFSKIAHICGEDCILQRFLTNDNFIISGHSIAYYPLGIVFDTSLVERTFEPLWERGWNFDYVFGPQRPALKDSGQKISWEIQGSEVRPDGSVLQTYLRRKDHIRWTANDQRRGDHDSVIELIWVSGDATSK